MIKRNIEESLLQDAARALGMPVDDLPADLTDKQLGIIFGLAPNTIPVKRSRGDLPIPSYKIGDARRTPLSSAIDYKVQQLKSCVVPALGGSWRS